MDKIRSSTKKYKTLEKSPRNLRAEEYIDGNLKKINRKLQHQTEPVKRKEQ